MFSDECFDLNSFDCVHRVALLNVVNSCGKLYFTGIPRRSGREGYVRAVGELKAWGHPRIEEDGRVILLQRERELVVGS